MHFGLQGCVGLELLVLLKSEEQIFEAIVVFLHIFVLLIRGKAVLPLNALQLSVDANDELFDILCVAVHIILYWILLF